MKRAEDCESLDEEVAEIIRYSRRRASYVFMKRELEGGQCFKMRARNHDTESRRGS